MEPFETTIEATPAIASAVYRSFIWRTVGGYLVASIVIAGLALWSLISGDATVLWTFHCGGAVGRSADSLI